MNNPFLTPNEAVEQKVKDFIELINKHLVSSVPLEILKQGLIFLDRKFDFLENKSIRELLDDLGWEIELEELKFLNPGCIKLHFKLKIDKNEQSI